MGRFAFLTLLAGTLLLISFEAGAQVPLPDNLKMVAPDAGIPQELAALSGKWYGRWSGALESFVIVEEIDTQRAKVIYAWGDDPIWRIQKGFSRHNATVVAGQKGAIEFGIFTAKISDDLSTLTVTRVSRGRVDVQDFKKVSQ